MPRRQRSEPEVAEQVAKQRQIADEVDDLIRAGRPRLAQQALEQAVADCLPDLPLRFSLLVRRIDEVQVLALAEAVRASQDVDLRLMRSEDTVQLRWSAGRLGQLSARDSELLRGFGRQAALYDLRVLEISFGIEGGVSTFAIELSRPEFRRCSSCGRLHSGLHINCEDCRRRRRPKGEEAETFEPAPVPLAVALEELLRTRAERSSDS